MSQLNLRVLTNYDVVPDTLESTPGLEKLSHYWPRRSIEVDEPAGVVTPRKGAEGISYLRCRFPSRGRSRGVRTIALLALDNVISKYRREVKSYGDESNPPTTLITILHDTRLNGLHWVRHPVDGVMSHRIAHKVAPTVPAGRLRHNEHATPIIPCTWFCLN